MMTVPRESWHAVHFGTLKPGVAAVKARRIQTLLLEMYDSVHMIVRCSE
jgi:hypothetical protein